MTNLGPEGQFPDRSRLESFGRRVVYVGLSRRSRPSGLGSFGPTRKVPSASRLRLCPALKSAEQVADVSARLNWYLGGLDYPISAEFESGATPHPDPEAAPWMDSGLVEDPGWSQGSQVGTPHNVVHHLDPRGALTIVRRGSRSTLADPTFSALSDLGWFWLRWGLTDVPGGSSPAALDRLFAMRGALSAFVLATGPSAALVDPAKVDSEVRISCNSIVRDTELLSALRPNVICFNDPCFHFGPSRYAAAFRKDLLRAVEELDPLLVTGHYWSGLLLAHYPELRDRLVVLNMVRGGSWKWVDQQHQDVRMTANVLTNSMLPIAFALASRIEIAGCDGRQQMEKYFWQHNPRIQYSRLMGSAYQAHPAFFQDSNYAAYYEKHCRDLAAYLTAAEGRGTTIVPVTPSWIPALRSRGAATPGPIPQE